MRRVFGIAAVCVIVAIALLFFRTLDRAPVAPVTLDAPQAVAPVDTRPPATPERISPLPPPPPRASIVIRVSTEAGAPLSNASAYFASSRLRRVNRSDVDVFKAFANGVIEISEPLPPKCDQVCVIAPGYRPGFVTSPVPGNEYEVRLGASVSAVFRCKDRAGAPLRGIEIALSMRPVIPGTVTGDVVTGSQVLPSGTARSLLVTAESDVSGVARCEGLVPGAWWLAVTSRAFAMIGGPDRPTIEVPESGRETDLVFARYYAAVARLEDPEGVVASAVMERPVDGVLPGQFRIGVLSVSERLRREHRTSLAEAVVFTRDPAPRSELPATVMTAVLRLIDSTVQEEDVPIQDPAEGIVPTILRPRALQNPSGMGRVVLKLRDVTGRTFDAPFQLIQFSAKGPTALVACPAGRTISVAPGMYALSDVPPARLWLKTWKRKEVVVEAGKETVIDALIPEAARLTTVSVASSQGAHPVAAFVTIVSGDLRVRYDFIGQDLEVILPDAHVELLVERRKPNGGVLGTFEISPAALESDGRIELTVDDE